jgi:1-acyl-sn-glycerol-3-phosphate acyltransferase
LCFQHAAKLEVIVKKIANALLKVSGWEVVGEVPDIDKAVYVAAPHTSNWDGFWLIVGKTVLDLEARFLAKHTAFWWPLGAILKWFGAIPVDRSRGAGVVQQLTDMFADVERLNLALAPEGTRNWTQYWKSGFYRIALDADVPMVLCFIDYDARKMGIGDVFKPSGDVEKDLKYLRDFYRPFMPRHPRNKGPIAFPPKN